MTRHEPTAALKSTRSIGAGNREIFTGFSKCGKECVEGGAVGTQFRSALALDGESNAPKRLWQGGFKPGIGMPACRKCWISDQQNRQYCEESTVS